jgi:hypothetical protein
MAVLGVTSINQSISLASGVPYRIKYSPKDTSGAVFDFTGYNVASSEVVSDSSGQSNPTSVSLTVVAADDTGITLEYSIADTASILQRLGLTRGFHSVQVSDGTDDVNIAYGNINVALTGY